MGDPRIPNDLVHKVCNHIILSFRYFVFSEVKPNSDMINNLASSLKKKPLTQTSELISLLLLLYCSHFIKSNCLESITKILKIKASFIYNNFHCLIYLIRYVQYLICFMKLKILILKIGYNLAHVYYHIFHFL
jgi:hypothetical protein